MKRIRYKGKKYGHLTMLRPSRSGGSGFGTYWIARCDCGTEKEVLAKHVSSGRTLTCGKCIYFKNIRAGGKDLSTRQRRDYAAALAEATGHGKKWELTPIEFQTYVTSECSICGTSASESKMKIERIDSGGDYLLENCVVTCSTCRKWKGSGDLQDMLDHIQKILDKSGNS